jgi:hypothetical protein
MKYLLLILTALLLAFAPPGANGGHAADTKDKVVVVDPSDLKPPLENPEAELTDKYDGKTVRFTGHFQATGQDARTKKTWHDLATEVALGNGPKAAKAKIVVRVYFQGNDRQAKVLKPGTVVTVEGKGEIVPTGPRPLLITEADVVDSKPAAKR